MDKDKDSGNCITCLLKILFRIMPLWSVRAGERERKRIQPQTPASAKGWNGNIGLLLPHSRMPAFATLLYNILSNICASQSQSNREKCAMLYLPQYRDILCIMFIVYVFSILFSHDGYDSSPAAYHDTIRLALWSNKREIKLLYIKSIFLPHRIVRMLMYEYELWNIFIQFFASTLSELCIV